MNVNAPGDAKRLAAELEAQHRGVPRAVAVKITELYDGGMTRFELATHFGLPIQMINLILRGAAPGVTK